MASYRFLYGSLTNQTITGELPVEAARYSHMLNAPGSLGVSVPLDVSGTIDLALDYYALVGEREPVAFVPMQEQSGTTLVDTAGSYDMTINPTGSLKYPGPVGIRRSVDLAERSTVHYESDFAGTTIDTAFWETSLDYSPTSVVQDGELRMGGNPDLTFDSIGTLDYYDLSNGYCQFKISRMPECLSTTREFTFRFNLYNSSVPPNSFNVDITGYAPGFVPEYNLYTTLTVDGVGVGAGGSDVTAFIDDIVYLRIGQLDGMIFVDRSADGETWTTVHDYDATGYDLFESIRPTILFSAGSSTGYNSGANYLAIDDFLMQGLNPIEATLAATSDLAFTDRSECEFELWARFDAVPEDGTVILNAATDDAGFYLDVAEGSFRFNRRTDSGVTSEEIDFTHDFTTDETVPDWLIRQTGGTGYDVDGGLRFIGTEEFRTTSDHYQTLGSTTLTVHVELPRASSETAVPPRVLTGVRAFDSYGGDFVADAVFYVGVLARPDGDQIYAYFNNGSAFSFVASTSDTAEYWLRMSVDNGSVVVKYSADGSAFSTLWVRSAPSWIGQCSGFVSGTSGAETSSYSTVYEIEWADAGYTNYDFGGAEAVVRATDPTGIVAGEWYHLVGSYLDYNVRLYVNGVLVDNRFSDTLMPSYTPTPTIYGPGQFTALAVYDEPSTEEAIAERYGVGSGTDTAVRTVSVNDAILYGEIEGNSAVFVEANGVVVWSGIIWTSQVDERTGAVTLGCEGWASYLRKRRVTTNETWTATDQHTIVIDLIDLANAEPDGDVGITADHNGTSGRARDMAILGTAYESVGELIANMADNIDGFDYDFTATITDGTYSVRLNLYYPASGRETSTIFESGVNVVGFKMDTNATSVVTRGFAINAGQDLYASATPSTDAGYPLLEFVESHSMVTEQDTLDGKAANLVKRGSKPARFVTLTLLSDDDVNPLGSYFVGDVVRVVSERVGFDESMRILELNVSIDTNGSEQTTLVLAPSELFQLTELA